MSETRQYIFPFTLATLLHVALVAVLAAGFAFPASNKPITPLAVKATLVQEKSVAPPPVEVEEHEPEPSPEPEPDEEQARIEAEEQKRLEDARAEQERLSRIEEAKREAERKAEEERQRIAAEEAKKKAEEEARRKREEEARRKREEEERLEEARRQAEIERQKETERQRPENERRRRELEAEARQREIEAEERRNDLIASGALQAYVFAINQKITRNWVKPASAGPGLECTVLVRQLPGGEVVSVNVRSCNGDAAVVRSVEAAVRKASPLPEPSDPSIFERNLTIIFKPEQ